MKILILGSANSRTSGGVFNSALMLGQNLHRVCGANVEYLMYNDEFSSEDRKYYPPLSLSNYNVLGPKKIGFSLNMYNKISSIKPDIIHTQGLWMFLSFINKQYHSRTKTPYIISPHGMLDPWQLQQNFWKDFKKRIVLNLFERKHLNEASCIHALCEDEYNAIRTFGLKGPIAIIPNGVNLPSPTKGNQEFPAQCRWKQTSDRKTLLFLSRIHHKKGLDNLLHAWALTQPSKHNWQLVIAGETKDQKYFQSLVNIVLKNRLTDTVQFIGGQFGLAKEVCFAEAHAFILPSFSEGLPLAVLEAWSYALPVVKTPFCNLPEGFSVGGAIRIDTSIESIMNGIQVLISMDTDSITLMGKNGYELVREKFTWEKVADSTMQLYKWVAGTIDRPHFVSV